MHLEQHGSDHMCCIQTQTASHFIVEPNGVRPIAPHHRPAPLLPIQARVPAASVLFVTAVAAFGSRHTTMPTTVKPWLAVRQSCRVWCWPTAAWQPGPPSWPTCWRSLLKSRNLLLPSLKGRPPCAAATPRIAGNGLAPGSNACDLGGVTPKACAFRSEAACRAPTSAAPATHF